MIVCGWGVWVDVCGKFGWFGYVLCVDELFVELV